VFPFARLAWAFTGVFGLSSMALVGLIGYARELQAQRSKRQRVRQPDQYSYDEEYGDDEEIRIFGPAESGFPGGWDEEFAPMSRQIAAGR
jgi:hypothetical protein